MFRDNDYHCCCVCLTHIFIMGTNYMSPQITLAQAKNGDKQFWKEKFHAASQPSMGKLSMGPVFPFGSRWGGMGVEWSGMGVEWSGGRVCLFVVFFSFSPTCSHCVSNLFPKTFSIAPH